MRSSPRERRLLAAVQEIGDMRELFRLRHAELGLAGAGDDSAQDVFRACSASNSQVMNGASASE